MVFVPLKAMCSNMCARPVLPTFSWAEPASTWVTKEKTGASGRSMRTMVSPLGRVFTVMRFSKEAMSWAAAVAASERKRISFLMLEQYYTQVKNKRPLHHGGPETRRRARWATFYFDFLVSASFGVGRWSLSQ